MIIDSDDNKQYERHYDHDLGEKYIIRLFTIEIILIEHGQWVYIRTEYLI